MIENQPKEITLIFHSDKDKDKKMRAFVETISTFKTKTLRLDRKNNGNPVYDFREIYC